MKHWLLIISLKTLKNLLIGITLGIPKLIEFIKIKIKELEKNEK